MLDRGSHKSAEELAYEQQRFDIHVMAFADRSAQVVAALQRTFSIDAAAAQRLLVETPVLVKRGATPEMADVLLDVLNRLGAQVVILPAPPASESSAEPGSSQKGGVHAAEWGGLDLQPAQRPASRPLAAEAQDDLEFDMGAPREAALSIPIAAEAQLLEAMLSEPPAVALSQAPTPGPRSLPLQMPPPVALPDLGLGSVPPLPELPALPRRSLPPPIPAAPSPPPVPPPRMPRHEPAAVPARVTRQRMPAARGPAALPLPGPPPPKPAGPPRTLLPATAATARAPAQRPIASLRPESTARARSARALETNAAIGLPRIDLASPAERRPPAAARGDATRRTELEKPRAAAAAPEPTQSPFDAPRPAKPKPAAEPAPEARSRGAALIEVVGGVLVFYLGLHLHSSIFHGTANGVSLVLHGIAIYGIGAGIGGLRP